MHLWSDSFADQAQIPDTYGFCKPSADIHVALSDNRNPHLAWRDAPEATRSFVVLCHDPDAPTIGDDVNQEGRWVAHDLPRADFFHWVLIDLSPTTTSLPAGSHSDGVTARGKAGPQATAGARHGLNDYTSWFASDAAMAGDYFGYDGPCPPWNDERVHRYVFTVLALDVDVCGVYGAFSGADVRQAIAGHVLDSATLTGTYSLNPAIREGA